MNDSDDDNLIGFIAGTVEGLREQVGTMSGQMTTKEDLARLEGQMETMRDQMATKEDLARFLEQRGLAHYKWPVALHRVEALPLSGPGKVNRKLLREHALAL